MAHTSVLAVQNMNNVSPDSILAAAQDNFALGIATREEMLPPSKRYRTPVGVPSAISMAVTTTKKALPLPRRSSRLSGADEKVVGGNVGASSSSGLKRASPAGGVFFPVTGNGGCHDEKAFLHDRQLMEAERRRLQRELELLKVETKDRRKELDERAAVLEDREKQLEKIEKEVFGTVAAIRTVAAHETRAELEEKWTCAL